MYVIMGKTASGKDTVVNRLCSEYGFKKIITYTTRPMRPNEENDKTYHFISEEDFINKIKSGLFFEWKSYSTGMGTWYYGSANEDIINGDIVNGEKDNSLIILTPQGYQDLIDKLGYTPKSIYLYANTKTMRQRLKSRGDGRSEIDRRISTDHEDFLGVENIADRIVYNNYNNRLDDVVDTVAELINNWETERMSVVNNTKSGNTDGE